MAEEGEQIHGDGGSNAGKWILMIVALLVVAAAGYGFYIEHNAIEKLTGDLATSQAQVKELQNRMQTSEAEEETLAQQAGMTKKELAQRTKQLQAEQRAAAERLEQQQKASISAVSGDIAGVKTDVGGVKTDLNCRVLNEHLQPIQGLYAAGEVAGMAGGHINGRAGLEGTMLGPAIFSGRVAGAWAAQAAGQSRDVDGRITHTLQAPLEKLLLPGHAHAVHGVVEDDEKDGQPEIHGGVDLEAGHEERSIAKALTWRWNDGETPHSSHGSSGKYFRARYFRANIPDEWLHRTVGFS